MISSLRDIHHGERIFMIGNGLSLSTEDLELIKDEYSFGVNYINNVYDKTEWRPSFYAWFDRTIWDRTIKEIIETNINSGIPVFLQKNRHFKYDDPNVYWPILFNQRFPAPFPDVELGQFHGWATALLPASHLALFMGFKELVFIGCCLGFEREQHHFYPNANNNYGGEREKEIRTLTRNIYAHEAIASLAKDYDARVWNATRGGELEVHPRVRIEEIT